MVTGVCHVMSGPAFAVATKITALNAQTTIARTVLACIIAGSAGARAARSLPLMKRGGFSFFMIGWFGCGLEWGIFRDCAVWHSRPPERRGRAGIGQNLAATNSIYWDQR